MKGIIYFSEELDGFKEEVVKNVTATFKEFGSLEPVLFGLVPNGDKLNIVLLSGLGTLFINSEGKDAAAAVIRDFNKEVKPIAIALASEGYMAQYNSVNEVLDDEGNFINPDYRPANDPNAVEVIAINFETFNKECHAYFAINRDKEAADVQLFHSTDWVDKSDKEGRLSNLLQENYSEVAQWLNEILSKKHNLN